MTAVLFEGCTVSLNPKLERQFTMPYIPVEPVRIGNDIQQKTQQIMDRNDERMIDIHKMLCIDNHKINKPVPPPKPQFHQQQQQYRQQKQPTQPQNVRQTQGYYYQPPPPNASNAVPEPRATQVPSRSTNKPTEIITGIISSAFNFGKGIVDGAIHGNATTNTQQQRQIPQQQQQMQYKYCPKCKSTNANTATRCCYCQSML